MSDFGKPLSQVFAENAPRLRGLRTADGLQINTPIYLNIDPEYSVTKTTRVFAQGSHLKVAHDDESSALTLETRDGAFGFQLSLNRDELRELISQLMAYPLTTDERQELEDSRRKRAKG